MAASHARDPKAYYAVGDREAMRIGKHAAAISFLVMGGDIVAVLWLFATHV